MQSQGTYIGCLDYGRGILLSLIIATMVINTVLSYLTAPSILSDLFRIYFHRLYKAKHRDDSMTYDNQGRH
ncbi:hypothetical protein XANCAGTX0491_003167 [Xanthoria calcicola]